MDRQIYPGLRAAVPVCVRQCTGKKDDFAVAFDAESGCFDESKGEPLFDDIGEPAAALKSRMEFLQRFHMESQRTQQLVKTLVEEGLLRPINVDVVRAADQAKFSLRNAMVVDEAKLQKLPGDKAATFIASGLLAVVYAHLISLQNFDAVANRTGGADSTSIPWWRK